MRRRNSYPIIGQEVQSERISDEAKHKDDYSTTPAPSPNIVPITNSSFLAAEGLTRQLLLDFFHSVHSVLIVIMIHGLIRLFVLTKGLHPHSFIPYISFRESQRQMHHPQYWKHINLVLRGLSCLRFCQTKTETLFIASILVWLAIVYSTI